MDKSPVFIFGEKESAEAKIVIREWIEDIDRERFFLPKLVVEYFMTVMERADFEEATADESEISVQDTPSMLVAKKYKKALETFQEQG